MRAGITRRSLAKLIGASGMALSAGALLAACGDDESVDTGTMAGSEPDSDEETGVDAVESADDQDDDPAVSEEDDGEASEDDRPVLIVAVQGLPDNLDPHQNLSNVGTRVTHSLFDHLFERDFHASDPPGSGFGVLPMLSTDWERIDDLTLEIRLRDDVLFHNGEPMTAEDVNSASTACW